MANQHNQGKGEGFNNPSRFDTGAVGAAMGKAEETASNLTDKAKDAASAVADKARNLASQVSDRASEMASDVGDTVSQTAHQAMHRVSDGWEASRNYLQQEGFSGIADDVTNLVRRNPLPALFIGFGLGFLLARSMRD